YDTITANRPEGEPLARLLASPNSAVVSQDTLDTLHLRIGDPITVNSKLGMNRTFTITGVVPDSAVNPFFGAGFWNDFAMVNIAPVASFFRDTNVGASTVYVKTTDAAQTASAKRELKQRLG